MFNLSKLCTPLGWFVRIAYCDIW